MEYFVFILEIIGTVAFAISGAVTGIKRNMDVFGVCILGLTTACGGGLIRDVLMGRLPPVMFCESAYALTAIGVSIVVFVVMWFHAVKGSSRTFETLMLVADAVGLGIFTVSGMAAAADAGYGNNFFFTVFLGVLTGVGGGLLRDMMAENPPYIFVKHIYACASIIGACLCALLWGLLDRDLSMTAGCTTIIIIRLLAARYRWSLPKIRSDASAEK